MVILIRPFHPSFVDLKTIQKECGIPCSLCTVSLSSVMKTWMEGTYDIPFKTKIRICDYWTKLDGVFSEMQIISYSFILKHI